MAIVFTATEAIVDPTPETPDFGPFTSDTFSGGDTTSIAGRNTDALAGGHPVPWLGNTSAFGIASGALVRTDAGAASSFFVGFAAPSGDHEITWEIAARPTSTTDMIFDLMRSSAGTSGTPNNYRVTLSRFGTIALGKRVSGQTTTFETSASGFIVPGDRLTIRRKAGSLIVLRNDVVWEAVEDASITAPGHIGISGSSATGFQLKNPVVRPA